MLGPEQRTERRANPPAIGEGEIAAQEGVIDVARAAGVARQHRALDFVVPVVVCTRPRGLRGSAVRGNRWSWSVGRSPSRPALVRSPGRQRKERLARSCVTAQ
jgi:hypothetical protein